MRKIRIILIFWLFLIPLLLSATIIDFEIPVIEKNVFQNDLPQMLVPGQPMISYVPVKILLPMGEKLLSLEIILQNQGETLENVYIDYARKMQPISLSRPDDTKKDKSVYTTNEFYPNFDYQILGTQRLKGYDLVLINIYPYKYNPVTDEIKWFNNAEVSFTSEYDNEKYEQQNNLLLLNFTTKSRISKLVINSEELSTYHKQSTTSNRSLVDPDDPYSMIIITDTERESYFNDFVTWKNDHGVSTAVFLTSDIYGEYTGIDDQEKIKNFITDAYITYSTTDTPLEYIILGGDDEIIPIRFVFI
ncbi:MAG: hypothetical protein KAU01_05550, partial [Candidatus Cloacimonetes bacterium]|nr:hypothetical protein [Candidatus Cloacimonadota bacterium]